ncbi:MAG: AAA family ATPase, partial [Deltaproteobacteria bacterium]|nr:AAA family ATPase [Deltaproteobacteria bacterium]
MKDLPIGMADFEEIRLADSVYADKTEFLRNLLKVRKPYFLSRPRRFGKSLLVSTLEAILRGRRELFQGLRIDSSDYDWTTYPVIRFSMDSIYSDDPEEVKKELRHALDTIVSHESFSPDCLELLKSSPSPGTYLASLIQELHLKYGLKPAILIDEYDAPIIRHLDQPERANQVRKILQQFYSALKHAEKDRGFTFITGVTKFTKASIFSALNNLVDLTLDDDYANICGFTLEEFDALFQDHLVETLGYFKSKADWATEWAIADLRREILAWYDGYSWDGKSRVLNPWSVLNFFRSNSFSNYWYNSGDP